MGPASAFDHVYLILRILLSCCAIAAAVNGVIYARERRVTPGREQWLARVGAALLAAAAAMSCIDGVDNVFLRWDQPVPRSSWLWLVCFDSLLPIYAYLLVRASRQRDRAEQEMARMVVTDVLTGALNRHGFFTRAIAAIGQARRACESVALAIMDLDHFKAINDTVGHAAGDEMLRRFAEAVTLRLRPGDVFGRLGGDEFALLLPASSAVDGARIAERLGEAVRGYPPVPGVPVAVTLSVGVTEVPDRIEPEPALVSALCEADEALYAAKEAGRDRVCLASTRAASKGRNPPGTDELRPCS